MNYAHETALRHTINGFFFIVYNVSRIFSPIQTILLQSTCADLSDLANVAYGLLLEIRIGAYRYRRGYRNIHT